jgi:hypothetical protein
MLRRACGDSFIAEAQVGIVMQPRGKITELGELRRKDHAQGVLNRRLFLPSPRGFSRHIEPLALLESGYSLLERAKFTQGSNFKNMLKLFCIGLGGSGLGADQKPEQEWRNHRPHWQIGSKLDRFFNSGTSSTTRFNFKLFIPGDEVAKKTNLCRQIVALCRKSAGLYDRPIQKMQCCSCEKSYHTDQTWRCYCWWISRNGAMSTTSTPTASYILGVYQEDTWIRTKIYQVYIPCTKNMFGNYLNYT